MKRFFTGGLVCLVMVSGLRAQAPLFGDRQSRGIVDTEVLPEISGAAPGIVNEGIIWVHNDSGGENCLYALRTDNARIAAVMSVPGTKNTDWEDIASGPGPAAGVSYLYIADIGDNHGRRDVKHILRVREPELQTRSERRPIVSSPPEIISFRYPEQRPDAETLLLDPLTRDLYIVTKTGGAAAVYRLSFPQSLKKISTAEKCAELDLPLITAGDISAKGDEILLKNYFTLYYWKRENKEIAASLRADPQILPYIPEPQGEAVCLDRKAGGFYTISEQRAGMPVHLFYYPEK